MPYLSIDIVLWLAGLTVETIQPKWAQEKRERKAMQLLASEQCQNLQCLGYITVEVIRLTAWAEADFVHGPMQNLALTETETQSEAQELHRICRKNPDAGHTGKREGSLPSCSAHP